MLFSMMIFVFWVGQYREKKINKVCTWFGRPTLLCVDVETLQSIVIFTGRQFRSTQMVRTQPKELKRSQKEAAEVEGKLQTCYKSLWVTEI